MMVIARGSLQLVFLGHSVGCSMTWSKNEKLKSESEGSRYSGCVRLCSFRRWPGAMFSVRA